MLNGNSNIVYCKFQMEGENQLHLDDLVHWLNRARENPQSLVPYIQAHLDSFRN